MVSRISASDKPTCTIRLWNCLHTSPKQWRPASRPEHCPVSQRTLRHLSVRRRGTGSKHIQQEYTWAHSYKYIARDDASGGISIRIRNIGLYVCVFSWHADYTALRRHSLRLVLSTEHRPTSPEAVPCWAVCSTFDSNPLPE